MRVSSLAVTFCSHRKVTVFALSCLASLSSFIFGCAAQICCSTTFHIIPLYLANAAGYWFDIALFWFFLASGMASSFWKQFILFDKAYHEWRYRLYIQKTWGVVSTSDKGILYSLVVDLIYHHPVISRKKWHILSLK